jgi:hypothetical protein
MATGDTLFALRRAFANGNFQSTASQVSRHSFCFRLGAAAVEPHVAVVDTEAENETFEMIESVSANANTSANPLSVNKTTSLSWRRRSASAFPM